MITKLLAWCLWTCQKRLTPFPMILLSKSLKITVETQSYQPRYELFK